MAKVSSKSLKNLKPWKKGAPSPNPSGRPLGQLNYKTLRELAIVHLAKKNNKTPLEIDIEITANALLEARKGNFSFYKDDADRVHGSATQNVKVQSEITIKKITGMKVMRDEKNKPTNRGGK